MHLSPSPQVAWAAVRSKAIDSLFIVAPTIEVRCLFQALLCSALSSFAIILMGKRELVALLCLSSWFLVIVIVL